MAQQFRPKLGLDLQSAILGPPQPPLGALGQVPGLMQPVPSQAPAKPQGGFFAEGGMGRLLAGAIGDALAQNAGMQPVFAPMQRQKAQTAQEEAQWTRRRQAEREDQQWKWANEPKEPPPMVRDAQAWAAMTPEQRAAYEAMMKARQGDPFLATTLPNDQFYAGPRSGLPGALGGGQAPVAPPKPVGKLTPIPGGAVPPASRPFSGPVPQRLKGGFMTSGRRTPEGNAAVGGVPNSAHLRGDAVDYDGPDLQALLAEVRRTLNPDKAFIHRGHVHTEKRGLNAPYYGKNGTRGLRGR